MPNLNELRLARAKAMAAAKYAWADAVDLRWGMLSASHKESFWDQACAIEAADAALGVVRVPREATAEMAKVGGALLAGYIYRAEDVADDVWSTMLAASPLREKSDEQ